jgi:hypothetical protein
VDGCENDPNEHQVGPRESGPPDRGLLLSGSTAEVSDRLMNGATDIRTNEYRMDVAWKIRYFKMLRTLVLKTQHYCIVSVCKTL